MESERPIIVDRQGRHLIWDPNSNSYVEANPDDQDSERMNGGYPESMTGFDPARDTEYTDSPRTDFGKFSDVDPTYWNQAPTDNYVNHPHPESVSERPQVCEQCHNRVSDQDKVCPNCLWPVSEPGSLPTHQQAGGEWSGGGFPDRDPKMNYNNQGDNGTYGKTAGQWDAPAAPGETGVGGKQETHRFVLDKRGDVYMEPVPMEHPEIVDKYGIDEAARGSIYNDGTADVHRTWVPINKPELEKTLGHHRGQFSIPLNYVPGQTEGQTEGMGARGTPIAPVDGYIWKQEMGIPHPELTSSVPLVFASEHTTPEDYPAYQNAKGFLTATGGATSHAAVEGRNKGMGGAVGIGGDYNKVMHGAPVSIREDGTVELGQPDPESTVGQYFERTPEDWAMAQQERQRKLQQYPEWVRTRGGSVFDKSQDELAIEAMTFGPKVAANLDECPECGDVMVDRPEGKVCANCGHTQRIINTEAATKESAGGGMGGGAAPQGWADVYPKQNAGAEDLAAGGLALAPLAIPLAGEAAGALGIGAAGDAAAAEAGAAPAEVGAGEAAAPGRVKSLINGAKSMGKSAIMYQGINSLLGGGGGGGGGQQQVGDYQGLVSHVDPRFDMWQYGEHVATEDDPDSLQLGGMSNDGDDVDPEEHMTKGNQEETGESLDELLKGLGDDGSANRGAYSSDQHAALDHFNKNLPVIVELALDDNDHSDHPVIQELEQMLSHAFPDFKGGNEGDEHKEHHQEEAHEAEKNDEQAKISAGHKPGCDCGFCQNKGKLPGTTDDDEDEDDVKESKTAWSVMDMSESEAQAIFSGQPTLELDFKTADMNPMPAPSAVSPQTMQGQGDQNQQQEQCASCGTQQVPGAHFCHNCGTAKADVQRHDDADFSPQTQVDQQMQSQPDQRLGKPAEHNKQVNPEHDDDDDDDDDDDAKQEARLEAVARTAAPVAEHEKQHDPVTPNRVLPGPDSAIDRGHDWKDASGQELQEGQKYLMRGQNYSVPDEVTIQKIKPTSIVVTINTGGIEFPNEISHDDLLNDGLSFEPASQAAPQEVQNAERGAQPDTAPGPGEQTDLSTPTTSMPTAAAEEFENAPVAESMEAEPVDGLLYTNDQGQPVSYNEYAASLRAQAPPHLAWLWDNVQEDVKVSDRESSIMQMTAGKNFTTAEQREFINEQGDARNKDKLDLDGTHYIYEDDDDSDIWFA